MSVANFALAVDHKNGWQAPQFPQIDFLVELVGDLGLDIGAADERNGIFTPVTPEGIGSIWTNRDHFSAERGKLIVVLAQLCQMFTAVWSGKRPQ